MRVDLIAMTQPVLIGRVVQSNPLAVVEQAASVCYDSKGSTEYKIAKGCAKSGHMSVYEHISFTFEVGGVTRALLAQLTRHRHLSFSVRSQRYCREDDFDYTNPFKGGVDEGYFDYLAIKANLGYKDLLEAGAKPEDARAILPNCCHTKLVVTANARALIEASHLRLCSRAQWEIRTLFEMMRKSVREVCPEVAELMVPKCAIHAPYYFCPESKSCGLHPQLKDVYGKQ